MKGREIDAADLSSYENAFKNNLRFSIICYYNQTMYTVIETPLFQRLADAVWNAEERIEFVDWIADNPLAGDVIPSAGPLRKVRWSRQGMGKRGGVRVIYFNRLANGEIVLLWVYTKAKLDNVRPEFLLKLKELFDE
ncbi:MAG: hypothetical protein Q8O19_07775 [Rectinemataceae bacterium]|nr:hypothetical protein [Rectinemataceae bacterium]